MVKIEVYANPFSQESVVYDAESVGYWLIKEKPENYQVFKGKPCLANDISKDAKALLSTDGEYTVLLSPAGAVGAFLLNPFFFVSVAATVALARTLIPELPSNINRGQQSKNNSLGNRTNEVRLLQRIEDIFGTVRSYPALIQPVYSKYINNKEYEYSYMCIGRGWYDVDDVRDGETALEDITGTSASFYNPFTSPNSGTPFLEIGDAIADPVLMVKRSNNVTGQVLKARNQFVLTQGGTITFTTAADYPLDGDVLVPASPTPEFFDNLSTGDSLTIAMDEYIYSGMTSILLTTADASDNSFNAVLLGTTIAPIAGELLLVSDVGFTDPANVGYFTVVSSSANKIIVAETLVNETASGDVLFQGIVDYSGSYTQESIPGTDEIELSTATFTRTISVPATIYITSVEPEWTDWVTLKDANMTRVFCNIIAPQGLYYDEGDGKTIVGVAYQIQVQQLDGDYLPIGSATTVSDSLLGATSDQIAKTNEITLGWTGATRVRARRSDDHVYVSDAALVDDIKYQDLYAVTDVPDSDFGNVTTVHVVTKATDRALALKERKFNCIASRKIPTYDGSVFSGAFAADGSIASGTIAATNRFIDIISAASVDPFIGNRVLASDIDIPQIWGVYQDVAAWDDLNAEFSYTLDSDNISFEETLKMIADSCFCMAYRQNGKVRLSFDTVQTSSTALFTHRNKRPASDTISRRFAADSEYDGVELTYNDNVSDTQETIKLPLDLSATNYRKVELTGVRNYVQAWYKANREYNKLLNQRIVIETETTSDGRLLLPNQRIDIVDNTRFDAQDGEIIAQDGLVLTLSRNVIFGVGGHSILLMQRDGSLESITVTAGTSANKVVLDHTPAEAINTINGGSDGIRTIFSFGSDASAGANSYLVQELTITDNSYVKVSAINYDAEYYAADTDTVPDRSTVL